MIEERHEDNLKTVGLTTKQMCWNKFQLQPGLATQRHLSIKQVAELMNVNEGPSPFFYLRGEYEIK